MREIKFRAFHFDSKEMLDYQRPRAWQVLQWLDDGQPVAVMQYTGLKDKNGKEIYEGDIVVKNEYLWFDKGVPNYRGTVEFIYSGFQVVAHCINPNKAGISDGANSDLNEDGFEENETSDWEIIGNVYENPELCTKP